MAVLDEIEKELVPPKKSDMVGGVSRGAVGRRRKKKPESVLDEVNREVGDEPEPEDVLTQVERETETDPETVRRMRAEGQRLSTEQQRIAFEAERARPLTDVALGAAKAFVPAAAQTVGQLARGTAKFAYEGVGKPVGEAVLAGLIYEPGSDEYEQALSRTFGGANNAVRSLASGVAQDIEETANAAVRAGMFGTSMTDIAAEKLGVISPEQSFNNYLAREEMRRTEAEDRMENPDRAATMLARNPLAGTVLQGASMLSGNGLLTPEEKQAGLAAYQEQLLQDAKFRPDEDISMLGEVVSPVGMPARLVKPLTSALGGTMEAAGGLAVRGVTKPTIRGVNPLEGVGIGIRKIGEGAEAAGAKVSEAITGRPDTFFATPGTIVSAFTRRPGQLIEGTGRTLRDIGRQIDEGGIRGRTGIIERLGRDPQTAPWLQDLFGPGSQKKLQKFEAMNKKRVEAGKAPKAPGRGGIVRARAADYGLRLANTLAKSGASGAALNGIIGAADIETAEEFGRATGVGFGIGSYMQMRIPERIGAALDPSLTVREKIDQIVETDPLDRRLDEEADLKRFRATADPELVRQVEKLASPEEQVAARMRELDELFQQKAEAEYAEKDTTELDNLITIKADEVSALQESTKNLDQKSRDERRRAVELIVADGLDLLKSNGRAAGLNGVNVQILDPSQIEQFVRERWGQTLVNAEAIQAQLSGQTDLSPSEEQSLLRANQTIDRFNKQKNLWPGQKGFALSESNQEGEPAHLRMANIGAPTIVMNSEQLMRDSRRVGLRYLLQHESNHVLEQFREVQEMQRPVRDLFFGKRVVRPDGTVLEATPGIITDEWINDVGIPMYATQLYGLGGEAEFREGFKTPQDAIEYVRSELMSELSAMSESSYSTIREALDSPGQAIIDRLLVSRKNSMLGRLRAALEFAGVQLDNRGDVKSVLFGDQAPFDPEVLAMMRQYKRELREFNDLLSYTGSMAEADVEISMTELMTNRALQEAYKDDVLWDKEVVLDVRDDEGNVVSQIVIPDNPATDSAVNEFRIVNGQLVDENGNVMQLSPGIDISGFPDGSRATIDTRIARNPDGSPKILQNKEIEARARQRDQMIKDAIDNAPDDGFEGRLRDTGNGSYRGIMSPSQLQAVLALPNSVIPPSLKRNIGAFNEVLQGRDGTRILMEYQPALRRGKYRALSPKIRDVVPIGYQFSKQGNFLATTISVSRMFDKMNLWAQKRPENLNLWGRDLGKFWEDVTRVLDNHNRGLAGQTGLDVDPDIAMQKKNRINDFFNLFTKETEAMNPSRTRLPARRGQDSADRLIMSARMDRINQMQISNAQKLPVDYGKMLVNFFPENEAQSLRLDSFQDAPIENDIEGGGMMPQFLPGIRYTSLPDDPKKTMADFYMLNAMLTTPPTGWSMGKFGGQATMYAPSADPTGRYAGTRGEKYQDALDEAKQTLIPTLHSKIMKALHFAVSAELRHALAKRQPSDLASSEFWQEYARQYSVQGSEMPDLKKDQPPRRFKEDNKGYVNSFIALENARKKLGMSVADVGRFAEQMFRRGSWSSSYGGNPWGDIAQHLAQMSDPSYSTERVRAVVTDPETGRMQMIETNEFRDPGAYSQMFQEIDRAYDLQHNTNTVFNKLKKYYRGSEGYGWIAKMLDFKANVGNPRELRGLVSGNMGKLADAWFADMRADAPLTQDLEERVKAQLPENFTIEAMEPQEFIDRLAKLAGTYYRKESSGVVREDPFSKIANDAERIHHNLKRGSEAWKEIKKDQNAHIGLILQDYFGDLGLAQTDAVKLFRMFLSEAKDPRVVGARKRTQIPDVKINLPKPAPKPSGEWFTGSPASGFTFIPKQNVSSASNLVAFSEALIFKPEGVNGLKLGDITVVNGGVTPEGVQKVHVYQGDSVSEENLKTTVDFTVAGKETVKDVADWLANYGFMQAKQSGYTSLMGWMAQDLTKSMKPAAQKPPNMPPGMQGALTSLPMPQLKIVNDYITSLETDQEFVDANLDNLPPSDIDKGLLFVKNTFPGIEKLTENKQMQLANYLYYLGKWASDKLEARKAADLAKMEDQPTGDEDPIAPGYSDENGNPMTASQVAAGIKAYDPGANDNHVFFTLGDGTAVTNPYEDETGNPIENPPVGPTEEGLIMKYWADKGVLPAVSEAALVIFDKANPGHTYKPDTKLWDTPGLKAKIDALDMNFENVIYDGGIPDTIEVSTKNGEITITKQPSGSTYQFQIDDQNWAIGPLDYVLKEAAEMLKKPSQAAENEKKAKAQAMEFLDNMLLDDPVKIGDNVWELESIEDDNGEITAAVVKLNDIAVSNQIPLTENMSIDAPPKAVYDAYFALDWMKDWKAPKTKSLLSEQEEIVLKAASDLMGGDSEVIIGDKKFTTTVNQNGNVTVAGYFKNGNLIGVMPIYGSQNMDEIDLEAKIYEALDVLGAGNATEQTTPEIKKPTETELNEAADELLNASDGDSVTVGGYEFQTVLGGQGGAAVNILPEGTRDIIDTFYYDASDFDNPSDLLDVIFINLSQFFNNLPGEGKSGPGAQMMPGEGITPKTLYNFYHLATLESQGRIKSEYGQSLMKEYLDVYRQRYLDTIGPLVADQIRKYIGRGRVDEPVTEEALEAAINDPEKLDELMRQTYRSDMKRRNDVWNNITEHLKGLEAARTPRDIIFRIDRLNNAIHNTNELLFSKFSNAADLLDTFEAINAARDERAYARNVDRDLRQIEEFEGGPGARFMPAEARGAFYHGTDKRPSTRLGPRGGEFYGQWEGDAVRVTYLSPTFRQAQSFGENVLEGRLKNRNIFDPTDEDDIDRVVRTALELGPDTSAIVEEAKTDPEAAKELRFIERGIRRDIAGGKDKQDGWRSVESYAGAIKAAGFDGYVAWEGGYAAIGAFPDRIDLREFEADKFGIETYDKYPKGSVRSRGSGNIQYMPGNVPDASQVDPGLAGVMAPDVDRGPLSEARFMPGYNPRYTDDDGNFDREAWLRDIQKGEEYLRRRGITRANTEKNLYEQMLRETLRGPRR